MLLRTILRNLDKPPIDIDINTMTCKKFKANNVWKQPELQPTNGPGDTWINYCISHFNETFENDISQIPCKVTCGFCGGISA